LGYVTFEKEKRPLFLPTSFLPSKEYSEDTAKEIDAEVKKIIDETYQRVKGILTTQKDKLEKLARLLLEKEVVEEADLKKIIESSPKP
jgi:cell division protease FtsH